MAPKLSVLAVALCLGTQAAADTLGSFNISVDGVQTRFYAVSQTWQGRFFNASPDGAAVSLTSGGRFYVAAEPMPTPGGFVPGSYWQAPLLGRELSYTVDLSDVGCSCNAALYFVSMPGHNASDPDAGDAPDATAGGDYYCGANAGKTPGNNYCPEMDILEANKFAMQVTPHACNGTNRGEGYYEMCDHRGCFANTYLAGGAGAMCPQASCTIDTTQPFRHAVAFETSTDNSTLTTIRSTLTQDGRRFEFPVCGQNSTYLQLMTPNLRAMVLTFSLWGLSNQGMSWLDGMTGCTGDCNLTASKVMWSDIELNTIG